MKRKHVQLVYSSGTKRAKYDSIEKNNFQTLSIEDKLNKLHDLIQQNDNTRDGPKYEEFELKTKIQMNIGGSQFTTSEQALTSDSESIFRTILDAGPNEEGEYFVDRNPKYFPIMLDHLRGYNVQNQINKLSKKKRATLYQDVLYYRVNSMLAYFSKNSKHNYKFACLKSKKKIAVFNSNLRYVMKLKAKSKLRSIKKHMDSLSCIVEVRDGVIVAGTKYGDILAWKPKIKIREAHNCEITQMIRINQERFATAGKGPIKIWSSDTFHLVQVLEKDDQVVNAMIAYENQLVSGGDTIRVWNMESGKIEKEIEKKVKAMIALSDGRILLGGVALMELYDLETDRVVLSWRIDTVVYSLLELHDGSIAMGDMDGNIAIWNNNEDTLLYEMKGQLKRKVKWLIELRDNVIIAGTSKKGIVWNYTINSTQEIACGNKLIKLL